jgi:hypothetical protein
LGLSLSALSWVSFQVRYLGFRFKCVVLGSTLSALSWLSFQALLRSHFKRLQCPVSSAPEVSFQVCCLGFHFKCS